MHARSVASVGAAVAWLASTYTIGAIATHAQPAGIAFGASLLVATSTVAGIAARMRWRFARPSRPLLAIGALLVASSLACSLPSGDRVVSLVATARLAAVATFAVALYATASVAPRGVRRALAIAAAFLIVQNAALLALAGALASLRDIAFETLHHQTLGALPRFRGLSGTPSSAGEWTLLALGLVQTLRGGHNRRLLSVLAVTIILATLSVATLALPAVLVFAFVRAHRARMALGALAAAAALVAMHAQPLGLRLGHATFALGERHPAWARDGLGARYMPVQSASIGPLGAQWMWTVYHYTALRAFMCVADHPLAGVGPRRFAPACPVTTMNTYGVWSTMREPHNQYTGWLAEHGLLGVLAVAVAALAARRSLRFRRAAAPWLPASLVGAAVVAFGGDALTTLPVAAVLAVSVGRRSRRGGAR